MYRLFGGSRNEAVEEGVQPDATPPAAPQSALAKTALSPAGRKVTVQVEPVEVAPRVLREPSLIDVEEVVQSLRFAETAGELLPVLANVLSQGMWEIVQDRYLQETGDEVTHRLLRELDTVAGIEACIGVLAANNVSWDGAPRNVETKPSVAINPPSMTDQSSCTQEDPRPWLRVRKVEEREAFAVPHVVVPRGSKDVLLTAALSQLFGDVQCVPTAGGEAVTVISNNKVIARVQKSQEDGARLTQLAAVKRALRTEMRGLGREAGTVQEELAAELQRQTDILNQNATRAIEEIREAQRATLTHLQQLHARQGSALDTIAEEVHGEVQSLSKDIASCEVAALTAHPDWRAGALALLTQGGGVSQSSVDRLRSHIDEVGASRAQVDGIHLASNDPKEPNEPKTTEVKRAVPKRTTKAKAVVAKVDGWDMSRSNPNIVLSSQGSTAQAAVTSCARRHLLYGPAVPEGALSAYWEVRVNGSPGESSVGVVCGGFVLGAAQLGRQAGGCGVHLTPSSARTLSPLCSGALGDFDNGDRLGLRVQVRRGTPQSTSIRLTCVRFVQNSPRPHARPATLTLSPSKSETAKLDWSTFRLCAVLMSPDVSLTLIPHAVPVTL